MPIRDFVAPGTLALGLVALTAGQNQMSVEKGKAQPAADPVPSSAPAAAAASGARGAASFAAFGDRVAFAETGTLSLDRATDGAYTSGFVVTNPECTKQDVSFSVQVFDRHHARLAVVPTYVLVERDTAAAGGVAANESGGPGTKWTLEPAESVQFEMTIKSPSASEDLSAVARTLAVAVFSRPMEYGYWTGHLPASGLLILTRHSAKGSVEVTTDEKTRVRTTACTSGFEGPVRVARPLMLHPPLPSGLDEPVLLVSFFLAMGATVVTASLVRTKLKAEMRAVGFDFTKSWAASLNVGAGLLNALMAVSILSPGQYSASSTTYGMLAALFAALVPMGSAVYGLIRPLTSPNQQGSVAGFLISSLIVLWGSFGQVLLLGMFLRELELARVLSPASAGFLIVVTKIIIAGLFLYAIHAMRETVEGGRTHKDDEPRVATDMVEPKDHARPRSHTPRAAMI